MSEWQLPSRAWVREFLQLYRSLPALWQLSSRDYKDRAAKARAYDTMVRKLREVLPYGTADCVRRRINILRTNFRKEMKKCMEAERRGATYTPKLWYYCDLLFLRDQGALRDLHDVRADEPRLQVRCVDQKVLLGEGYVPALEDGSPSYSPTLATSYSPSPDTSYHSTLDTSYSPPAPSDIKCEAVDVEELEPLADDVQPSPSPLTPEEKVGVDDIFARHVTSKLRCLDPLQRIFAEKLIHDVLFEAQLGTLTRASRLQVEQQPSG